MRWLLLLSLLNPLLSVAQRFTLADTVFRPNAVFRTYEIAFANDKAVIHPESHGHLDSIAAFMIEHPSLTFELSDHGSPDKKSVNANRLSQARADAIRDYLVAKGVDASRLVAQGYGNTKPLIPDEKISVLKSKEEIKNAKASNRRTEFRILTI